VALLTYRGNPHSGGQGVYVRHLSRELAALGHDVEVLSGPPYPELDAGVRLTRVPSLDLYREPDPFRLPRPREFTSAVDVLEFLHMCSAGFPEPLTFSLRVARLLGERVRRGVDVPDVVHDNQGLGYGLLPLLRHGFPVLATVHHPITVDRDLDLAAAPTRLRRLTLRRWYGFVGMQRRVLRHVPRVLSVSDAAAADITMAFGLPAERVCVVPVGVDPRIFAPQPELARVPGRLVAVASADAALKGLPALLEAVAKLRVTRDVSLEVVGRGGRDAAEVVDRLGIADAVRFSPGVSTDELVRSFARAEVAVVPSLYEGFSLPAVEAMACEVPLVATTGGALPEVVGPHGHAGLLVPPGDGQAIADAVAKLLAAPDMRARMGRAGRARVQARFTWRRTAELTAEHYSALLHGAVPSSSGTGRGLSPIAHAPAGVVLTPEDEVRC
jgi:glycosyltransferase involved in cell wall biosynthesis